MKMDNVQIMNRYNLWRDKISDYVELKNELEEMEGNKKEIEDAFFRNLSFGTGGLRGIIGAGTNRMNRFTVAKASQGLANYIVKCFSREKRRIAVSYDSRIKSDEFACVAASVFAANGIKVYLYSELMPTPCLSFAVRVLSCAAGVMVTASHNPAKYNGYKVYGNDGCQITTEAAAEILEEIEKVDLFEDVKDMPFIEGKQQGLITYIKDEVITEFIEQVKKQSLLSDIHENMGQIVNAVKNPEIDKSVSIVYSPLNGTGLKPVMRVLTECGFENIFVVPEQEKPDGNFPTCPYPNPEVKEAMALGIEYAKKRDAELLLATDPDCDRVGIAVKNTLGDYTLLSGNETGILLLDFICERRIAMGTMPDNPVLVKTIVTTDLAEKIAADYGVRTHNVLTGFKFIGEFIGNLEKEQREESYIFGFEESYGYLSGSYVRDKDAVNGTLLICEMFAYYKSKGTTLLKKLDELYEKYGYCLNTLHSYVFEGADGETKMKELMKQFRDSVSEIGGEEVERCFDYANGLDGLPKSDVIKFILKKNCSIVVRPSGTEPKLKLYFSITAKDKEAAKDKEKKLVEVLETRI